MDFHLSKPDFLGVIDGRLAPLGKNPNCVSTYEAGHYEQLAVLSYADETPTARARLIELLKDMDGQIEEVDDLLGYVHATFRSPRMRFVDDVEFLFDDESKTINFRAGARMGVRDMGANIKRMQKIAERFNA